MSAQKQLVKLLQEAEAGCEWPMGLTDEDVARCEQGKPDGETWGYIQAAASCRERLQDLRLLDAYVTQLEKELQETRDSLGVMYAAAAGVLVAIDACGKDETKVKL